MKIHNENLLENFYKHNKINVAILTDIFYPNLGGAAVVARNMAQALFENKDVNVVVVTGELSGFTDKCDYPVIRCKAIKIPKVFGDFLPVPNLDSKFKKLMEKLNIDIIHLHTIFGLCTFGLKFAKKHNIPVVIHGHSKFSEEYKTLIKSKLIYKKMTNRAYKILNKTNMILPVSNVTKENYIAHNVTVPMTVVPNTTNFKLVENKNNEVEKLFKEKYNISNTENILLYVGRLEVKCKNLDFLLESLKKLKEKNFKFKMLMVGGGNEEQELKTLCHQLNLDNDVIFVGKITDQVLLSKYYYFANLLCFPSVIDNCPLVKCEAASQKTPMLSINGAASSEGIIDNYNGFLSNLSQDEYSDKIIEIFKDKEKLIEVSENANKTLNKGWNNVCKDFFEIYKNLLENKSNSLK